MDRPATLQDVAECYRLFLERDIEDASTAIMQTVEVPSLWELINRFASGEEAVRRKVHRASGFINDVYNPLVIDMKASDHQREELLTDTLARWERCGRGFAYDQLFRDPRLFDARSGKWNREKKFESGEEELQRMLRCAQRNGLMFPPGLSMLALGYEVSALASAIGKLRARLVGLEISSQALEEGSAAVQERGIGGVALISLRSFLEAATTLQGRTYDIFYSVMLLQHAPPPVILMLLNVCLGSVKPGGYAYFQVPCHLHDGYRYESESYLAGRLSSDDSGELHALPQSYVLQLLARHGMIPIEILPDSRLGPAGLSFTFFACKQA